MKKRLFIVLAGLLCLPLAMAGCAGSPAIAAGDLMAGVQAAEWPDAPPAPDQQYLDSIRDFTWRLLRESTGNPGNILLSPASVHLALAMTLNGADGTTREAMLAALSAGSLSLEQLNTMSRDWSILLQHESDQAVLAIANSIWYRTGFTADPDFLQRNADYFAAAAHSEDFADPKTVDLINGWVSDATQGRIDKMIEEIGPAVVMYLINTIYFKADWAQPFLKNDTKPGDFTAPDKNVIASFMHRTGSMTVLDLDGSRGVLLPYADQKTAFFAVLPPEGQDPRQLVLAQDSTFLSELLASGHNQDIELALPAFKSSYTDSLVDEMKKLGMAIAFGGGADFSLMDSSRSNNLFISEIKHKTFLDLNENGTEAAAATLVEIMKTSIPTAHDQLVFNRPFLYGLVDQTTGAPIFIGILEDPTGN